MATVASKVPFHELAGLVERISTRQGTDGKKQLLKKFVDEWRNFHGTIHKDDPNTTDSFYPAMRLLLPQLEKERDAYGIKEHTLAKLYIDILGLGKDSAPAQKLLNYRAPKSARNDAGDFATVAYWVLKPRCPEKGTLTIADVNAHLDNVAVKHAAKDKSSVNKSLLHMLKNMSALEQKWLIRMIMKDLKMGISQLSVFSVFHQDAEDVFNVKMSLEKVCTMLHNPDARIHEIEVSLFSPFRPMLGDRGSPHKIEKIMDNKTYFIETKFDGERMQMHKKDDEYKFYSRGGNDYTNTYGHNPFDGNFVPHISNCFKDHVKNCILDGEMCGYNPVTKVIGSKGENFDIKSTNEDHGYQPMLCVFDILLLNDEILSNKPLKERKEILKDVIHPVEGRIILSEYKDGKTKQDCVDALNEAIDRREEGVMVKDPDSVYKPNMRKGGWIKIKPEYIGGLMDELDLLVVGGYFGVGHRAKLLSHFLLAVAEPVLPGEKPQVFHSIGKVGSGYNKKELFELNKKLSNHWQPFSRKDPPQHLQLAPGLKQRPDLWIEPDKSIILQVKAAEIIQSDQYKTGYTLRFPRVEKIRDDKPWYDCFTTKELEDLRQKCDGKLTGKLLGAEEEEEPSKKKRKVVTTKHVKPTVMSQFKGADTSSVEQTAEVFQGKEFCLLSTPDSHSKADLEVKIVEYGGSCVQNPGAQTFCILADKITLKVSNIIKMGAMDVVKVSWLLKCIDRKKLLPWVPSDMIHTSMMTAMLFEVDYDKHGDSYFDNTDEDQLKDVFKKIEEKGATTDVNSEDLARMEDKYFPLDSPHGLFRICRVYLDSNLAVGDSSTHIKSHSLELVALELRYYGATLDESLGEKVSHVIMDSRDTARLERLQEVNRERTQKFHIVTQKWVCDSVENEKLMNERAYHP